MHIWKQCGQNIAENVDTGTNKRNCWQTIDPKMSCNCGVQ